MSWVAKQVLETVIGGPSKTEHVSLFKLQQIETFKSKVSLEIIFQPKLKSYKKDTWPEYILKQLEF